MADGQGGTPAPDPLLMARDWITIWQSELAALATNRELQESWLRMVASWAQAAESAARLLAAGDAFQPRPPGHAGADAPPGAAAAMAAPDARDAAIQRLGERIDELERRLAGQMAPGGGGGGGGTEARNGAGTVGDGGA